MTDEELTKRAERVLQLREELLADAGSSTKATVDPPPPATRPANPARSQQARRAALETASGPARGWVAVLIAAAWAFTLVGAFVWMAGLSEIEDGGRGLGPWTLLVLGPTAFGALVLHGLAVILDQTLELRAEMATEARRS